MMSLSKLRHRRGTALSARYLKLLQWNMEGVIADTYGNKLEDPVFLETIKGEDLVQGEYTYGTTQNLDFFRTFSGQNH